MSENAAANTAAWCAGLKFAGRRELSTEERVDLQARARRLRLRGWLLVISGPMVFVVLFPVCLLQPELGALAVVTWLLLGVPLCTLTARDSFRGSRTLREDERAGYASRFEGQLAEEYAIDAMVQALLRAGLLKARAEEAQWIEVLPASRLVWRVNGMQPERWIPASCAEVAETPAFASLAAEWVQPAMLGAEGAPHVNQRDLSQAERGELALFMRALLLRSLPLLLLFNLWACFLLFDSTVQKEPPLFFLFLAATVWVDWKMLKRLRLRAQLAQDLQRGSLMIVRWPVTPPEETPDVVALSPPLEILPASRVLWTVDGRPAPWRTIRVR